MLAAGLTMLLAGCAGGQQSPGHTTTGRPMGIVAASPPADSSFTPLRCLPDGPATICTRHQ